MKTMQECLREADRKEILDKLAYRFIDDTLHLLELKDRTVAEIMERYSHYMDRFIEMLLTIEAIRNEDMVFYLHSNYPDDNMIDLISIEEVKEDIDALGHDFEFPEWSETVGYLVADTKQTQDDLLELCALYLEGASFFGTDAEERKERLGKVIADLDRPMASIEKTVWLNEEVFDDIRRKHGLPVPEHDPEQKELESKAIRSTGEVTMYCRRRERKRILKSIK